MKAIILAAGYATRLYPLTRDFPKPLLDVAGRTIIDRLVDNLSAVDGLTGITVVTNARFAEHFEKWAASREAASRIAAPRHASLRRTGDPEAGDSRAHDSERRPNTPPIRILNDGSTDNENRLGALRDLYFARTGQTQPAPGPGPASAAEGPTLAVGAAPAARPYAPAAEGPTSAAEGPTLAAEVTLVAAGDNIFDFPLREFVEFQTRTGADCICAHELPDRARLGRTGVVRLADDGRVLEFQEKPAEPVSSWAVPPLYLFRPETLETYLPEFLTAAAGAAPAAGAAVTGDAPGSFIPWLLERVPVFAHRFAGARYDIGNHESYAAVKEVFSRRERNAPDERHLHWDVLHDETILEATIFRMKRSRRRSSDGREADYFMLETGDWVNVVALTTNEAGVECFIMVRQFRHGSMRVSLEFPGGLVDPGELPLEAITRELTEETGYVGDRFEEIGSVNPNPALMGNRCYTYLVRDCRYAKNQNLDANEIIDVELVPVTELLSGSRNDEFDHALMHVALGFFRDYSGQDRT